MREDTAQARSINETWTDYPRHLCLDQIFSGQARVHPDAVALVYNGREMTYRALDEASNRFANYMASRGCSHEAVIGLCMDRSLDMMVAILAILKAGGAYLPLDAEAPDDRLRYIVDHADCPLIVGRGERLAMLAESGRPVLDIDRHRESIAAAPTHTPRIDRSPADLAYVMYTSGTTGEPKGVMVEHSNVARLVLNTNYVVIGPRDVFLQLAPIAFDASTFEIWGALLNGAKLVLYDRPQTDIVRIATILGEYGVSILWLSAGLFNQIVQSSAAIFKPIKQLLVGGDVLSVSHVRRVMERHPECQVINGYGPTECTTFSVCCRLTREDVTGASVPIGRPVANAQVYILDEDLHPVPVGEVGELFIGGEGLSRGYLGAPDLTAQKFLNVASQASVRRLYRTGDFVRLGEDGKVYFLGRVDRQIKVRGYRVEPAEIEAALLACPGVAQAVVVGDAVGQGDKRLVAYLVGESGSIAGSRELRSMLESVLPHYMIPATFVYLDRIPLTANGKVDRDALPKPEWKPLAASSSDRARTAVEKFVDGVWAEVFAGAVDNIGTSIVQAGGTRRHLEEILAKVSSHYGIALDPRAFDERATSIAVITNTVRSRIFHPQRKEPAYESASS